MMRRRFNPISSHADQIFIESELRDLSMSSLIFVFENSMNQVYPNSGWVLVKTLKFTNPLFDSVAKLSVQTTFFAFYSLKMKECRHESDAIDFSFLRALSLTLLYVPILAKMVL